MVVKIKTFKAMDLFFCKPTFSQDIIRVTENNLLHSRLTVIKFSSIIFALIIQNPSYQNTVFIGYYTAESEWFLVSHDTYMEPVVLVYGHMILM